MSKKTALFTVVLMMLVSLSGCLGGGGGGETDMTERSPEDVESKDYNVLYIGHSFGRRFAETLEDYAHTAGISNHTQYIEFSGGDTGTPGMLWEDEGHRERIKQFLGTGEIDVLIMICCSPEFKETNGTTDQAMWNFSEYALDQNPNTRIGLALPWADYPDEYANASEHRNTTDIIYPLWEDLASNLSADFSDAEVFTLYHGATTYKLREMFEAGELENDVENLQGPKPVSIFTDQKGHAGQITQDTGSLIWLYAVHGIEPMSMPEFAQYEVDIRQVAQTVIDEQSSHRSYI